MEKIIIWITALLGGGAFTTIVSLVIFYCLKAAFNKQLSKIDVAKIVEKKVNEALKEKVETVAFTHSIQPVVESELQKINEKSNEYIQKVVSKVENKLDKVILIQEKQAAYFDNSIGVSESAKKELKAAIESAKVEKQEVVESVIVSKEEIKTTEVVKPVKNKVSR